MRRSLVAGAIVGGLALAAAPVPRAHADAGAEPDLARRSDRTRLRHGLVLIGLGGGFMLSEFGIKEYVAGPCRWCDPPGFDHRVRDALVWDDPDRAAFAADMVGYVAAPTVAIGLLWASTWCDRTGRRWYDDAIPVLEAGMAAGLFDQLFKFTVRRARPLAAFGDPGRAPDLDDNTSFFSGHTALAFAIAVSAGTVAHRRGYRLEPVIWTTGLAIAATTGYLRMAADKHYLSDVAVGAAVGAAFGYLVPRWFHRDVLGPDLAVTPTASGVALVGSF